MKNLWRLERAGHGVLADGIIDPAHAMPRPNSNRETRSGEYIDVLSLQVPTWPIWTGLIGMSGDPSSASACRSRSPVGAG